VKIILLRWLALVFVVLTLTVLLSGCVVTGGGYGYPDGGGIGAVYYESPGIEYGGWGAGYQVAPFRDGDHRLRSGDRRQTSGGGRASTPAYRPAPASRAMPSIPSKSRSGGSQSRGVQPRK
jgi:hypothetical protein